MSELYIGLMSGTSMDAVDAVLVDFSCSPLKLIASCSLPVPAEIKKNLLKLCSPGDDEINHMGRLDNQTGLLFAEATNMLVANTKIAISDIKAIGSHGQTIRHEPVGKSPYTLQIGNPFVIAQHTGIMTIADFRRADIAVGGQGAPLAPAFHNDVFRKTDTDCVVLNIGGMANITFLPADLTAPVTGFDTGPGNVLMDYWCMKHQHKPFDEDGQWAASGKVQKVLLQKFLADQYFKQMPPKSTGRERFNEKWLSSFSETGKLAPEDVQATLCAFTAESIALDIERYQHAGSVIVCGGGAYNQHLMQVLSQRLPNHHIESSKAHGIEPDWVEAIAFAWLARRTMHHQAGNLPAVTGANRSVILGAIYPAPC